MFKKKQMHTMTPWPQTVIASIVRQRWAAESLQPKTQCHKTRSTDTEQNQSKQTQLVFKTCDLHFISAIYLVLFRVHI